MANVSSIFGLKPVRGVFGQEHGGQLVACYIDAADATAMAIGDPVVMTGSASPQIAGASQVAGPREAGVYPTVTLATAGAGNEIAGVIVGFEPLAIVGFETTMYRQANTARIVHVAMNPDTEFEVQAATGTVPTVAMVGGTCDLVAGAVDTVYGRSGWQADLTTAGAVANGQLRIMGIVDREDNELLDVAKLRVKINLHQMRSASAGV